MLTNIVEVYLGGKKPIKNLIDDLQNITRAGRVGIMGDMNTFHYMGIPPGQQERHRGQRHEALSNTSQAPCGGEGI